MSIARIVAPFAPIILVSTAAIAQAPADAPPVAASASASVSASAAPSNAPIVLSPGVSASPPAAKEKPPVHHADDAGHETRENRAWFGWQTLGVDIVVLTTTAVLLRTMDERAHLGIVIGASALYLGSGPLIHAANGSGRAGDSLLIRLGGIGIGGLAGALLLEGFAGCSESSPCKLERVDFAAIGASIGAAIATVVDGTMYAWKPLPGVSAHLTPTFAHVKGGGIGGLAITF